MENVRLTACASYRDTRTFGVSQTYQLTVAAWSLGCDKRRLASRTLSHSPGSGQPSNLLRYLYRKPQGLVPVHLTLQAWNLTLPKDFQ